MPWKTMDVREQRVQFVVAAIRREKSFGALCGEFGISRPTGGLWLRRYQQHGVEGIAERSRRPRHSPRLTASAMEEQVVKLRQRYPDWGARKLQVLLQRDGVVLTHSTIHRILLRRGLVHPDDRHSPAVERFERSAPNELWQMDFKGPLGWYEAVGPLSVLDDHSRYVVVLQALGSTRVGAGAGAVRKRLLLLRGAGGDVDGPRRAVVEWTLGTGADTVIAVAHEAGDRIALEPGAASADAGQGRALSWRVAAGAGPARHAATPGAAVVG